MKLAQVSGDGCGSGLEARAAGDLGGRFSFVRSDLLKAIGKFDGGSGVRAVRVDFAKG